jgi:chemosensory pili system protein ChpA (sensor histidine kinase/response regulator)
VSVAGQAPIGDDLSALSWVHDELRKSLEQANKALRRYLREAEAAAQTDLDHVDPGILRQARSLFHQGVGVLEVVGMGAAANMLRAAEAAVVRLSARPRLLTPAAVETIERGSFALLDYLARVLVAKPVSPLKMFPQYRALQELAAASRIHPADLWPRDWQWRPIGSEPGLASRSPDATLVAEIEAELLALMKGDAPAASARMSDLFAAIGAGTSGHHATLWRLAAAFFEAQAAGQARLDVYSKRVASRLLAQLRSSEEQGDASDRLGRDLLFFCAQAAAVAGAKAGPRLGAVRSAYGLDADVVVDYETAVLGRFDPAWIAQARKRVGAAKEIWSELAAGDLARLPSLNEQFALVGDSIQRLYPDGGLLSRTLQAAAGQTSAGVAAPPAALAMEVATALLYLDASLADGDFDDPDLAERIARLALRIGQVRHGRDPGPIELWMEDLYRRVSDRQTMGSVVQELRAALSEVEKHIDQYFRNPAQREVLIPVPAQLSAMRGVLSVLGLDHASQAVVRMRNDVDALASTEVDPVRAVQAGTFDHLADNLGALSFLIDMVSVQPQMAKSMFRFDPAAGKLVALVERRERPTAFGDYETSPSDVAALSAPVRLLERVSPPQLDDVPTTLAGALESLGTAPEHPPLTPARSGLPSAWDLEEAAPTAQDTVSVGTSVQSTVFTAAPAGPTGLEDDVEMRSVFLDEAREVIDAAKVGLTELQAQPADFAAMTAVRRAFHTLKGSSRMVGLRDFGDAAWACEQLYNQLLAGHGAIDPETHGLTTEALGYFARWVDALATGDGSGFDAQVVVRAADAMRLDQRRFAIAPAAEAAPPPLTERVPGLPLRSDLDLGEPAPAVPIIAPAAEPAVEAFEREPEPASAGAAAVEAETRPAPLAEAEPPSAAPTEAGEPLPVPEVEEVGFDLAAFDEEEAVTAEAAPPAAPEAALELGDEAEPYKRIGDLRIGITLFNIYLNEADEWSRRLGTELAEWVLEQHRPVPDSAVALAHSLAGSSATVGYTELSMLARALEHALDRSREHGRAGREEAQLFGQAADEIRRLLHQFAAGFLRSADPELLRRLDEVAHAPAEPTPAVEPPAVAPPSVAEPVPASAEAEGAEPAAVLPPPVEQRVAPAPDVLSELGRPALMPFAERPPAEAGQRVLHAETLEAGADIDAVDAIDAELFPVFEEEAVDLLGQLHARLREWSREPHERSLAAGCMRTLHTLKGGARLAGAMRLGEQAHRLESAIEQLLASAVAGSRDVESLIGQADTLEAMFDALRRTIAAPSVPAAQESAAAAQAVQPAVAPAAAAPLPAVEPAAAPPAEPAVAPEIDWRRFQSGAGGGAAPGLQRGGAWTGATSAVRVRAALLDRLVNQAGEISITRARLGSDLAQIAGAMRDQAETIERLRTQLRELELQGELQIGSRLEAARALAQDFDPLEMDRFTRFQELTRMMAESVADVATVQRGLQRALQSADDELVRHARLTHEMQDDLLRTRMVEFEVLSERLYRVVRQAAKESGRQVRLDIVGGSIEIDRGVLERVTGAFEHLLRNAVGHGIETPAERQAAGKDPTGSVTVTLTQVGNEVAVEVRDDGAGLNLARIRERALALGLFGAGVEPTESALSALIFEPGFSTADRVTGLAGRGVGMDVVRTDVAAIGGRIETASAPGQGTSFRIVLPLTTAVTQVVMLRCGERSIAVPSPLIEIVRRVPAVELAQAYASGSYRFGDRDLPFFWLDALLQGSARGIATGRTALVVVIRSADQRVALHVDEVQGNQEVVVKNLGPQLSRLPGLVGMTLLPSGVPALIYNPVALATLYGETARGTTVAAQTPPAAQPGEAAPLRAPLIAIVDDSLTVRRVTQRLLEREGYRVAVAKDGLEGLELVAAERPAVLLTDIEMPRMDGFDLVRNLRADPKLADLPVIMITSRIAQKHRDYAAELGVDHYLGKPYAEDELLALLARYARRVAVNAPT